MYQTTGRSNESPTFECVLHQDGETLKLQNGGRPGGVAKLYSSYATVHANTRVLTFRAFDFDAEVSWKAEITNTTFLGKQRLGLIVRSKIVLAKSIGAIYRVTLKAGHRETCRNGNAFSTTG